MVLHNNKGFGLIWLFVLLTILVISGAGYLVFQSNSDASDPAMNLESTLLQSEKIPEVNAQDTTGTIGTGITITSDDSEYGAMLFDENGQAIYIWELENSTKAECYDDCAIAWPPVLTDGAPIGSADVKNELLGTTVRTDGTTQVTYNGHPLYYYAHEEAGEVKCHDISTHGGLWWVIQPNGVRAD